MFRRVHAVLFGAAAVAASLVSPPARAEEKLVALDYEAGDASLGCPNETSFRRKVEARLGYDPFTANANKRLRVRFKPARGGITAETSWGGAKDPSKRTFDGARDHCEDLVEAVASAAAIAIDPLKSLAPPPPPPLPPKPDDAEPPTEPLPVPESPKVVAVGPPIEPPRELAASSPLISRLALSFGAGAGLVPGFGLTPELGADLFSGFVVHAGVKVALAASAAGTESLALHVTRLSFPVGPCVATDFSHLCVLIAPGVALAELNGDTKSAFGLDITLRTEVDVLRNGPLRVFPYIEGSGAAARARVRAGDVVLWSQSPLSFDAGVGLAYRFGGR
jgi:hypothetical protein